MTAHILTISSALIWTMSSAMALEAPRLPASAKKLDADGIYQLYHGTRASYDNYQNDVSLTGEIFYDLKSKVMFGNFNFGDKDKGLFRGKIRIKGDQFCNKPQRGKETCTYVYRDGQTYYEVGKDGKVLSVDKILENPPKPLANAKPMKPDEVLEYTKGKRMFTVVFDAAKPLVADVVYDQKRKKAVGTFIFGGEKPGKVDFSFKVRENSICWPEGKQENCYQYFGVENGFYELTSEGKMHAWSTFQ